MAYHRGARAPRRRSGSRTARHCSPPRRARRVAAPGSASMDFDGLEGRTRARAEPVGRAARARVVVRPASEHRAAPSPEEIPAFQSGRFWAQSGAPTRLKAEHQRQQLERAVASPCEGGRGSRDGLRGSGFPCSDAIRRCRWKSAQVIARAGCAAVRAARVIAARPWRIHARDLASRGSLHRSGAPEERRPRESLATPRSWAPQDRRADGRGKPTRSRGSHRQRTTPPGEPKETRPGSLRRAQPRRLRPRRQPSSR